jgi:arsenite-transporting ATPase
VHSCFELPKTSTSAALAIQFILQTTDLSVLVVSTDPAHSLGDALDVDLKTSQGKPVRLTDPLTQGRLYAAEVNAEAALQSFQESLSAFQVNRLADSLGIPVDILQGLGLQDFEGLLRNPPPGIDELVALGNVMDPKGSGDENVWFDVVIVDTAPTGHSLRLLALPQFLDGLLGKLLKLRAKLAGLTNTLKMFLGDSGAQERAQTLDDAMDKVETFRRKMKNLETTLKDKDQTSFMIVTIPTKLAMEESKRLWTELKSEKIAVNHIVVNQCVEGSQGSTTAEALGNYYRRRVTGQQKWIGKLQDLAADVSASVEYQENTGGGTNTIAITELPFFDVELVGVPALGYVGAQHFSNNPHFKNLMQERGRGERGEPTVVICGGKGGVGKSTFLRRQQPLNYSESSLSFLTFFMY